MSIGNLKDSGNQGKNFPFQLKVLQGLDKAINLTQCKNLTEYYVEESSTSGLTDGIQYIFNQNPDKYLVSKTTEIDATGNYRAFITLATL